MNWRSIRWFLIILLVVLNVVLFGYSRYIDRQLYVVPASRIADARERFADWGYTLPDQIPDRHRPAAALVLQQNDLETRADQYWSTDYEKSYMVDARVLYTCGTETLTVDRDHSNMIYTQNDPAYDPGLEESRWSEIALQMAQGLTGVQDLTLIRSTATEDGVRLFYFCEKYDGKLLFANQTIVTVTRGAVVRAVMTQYQVQGYETEKLNQYPVDELLYTGLRQLGPAAEDRTSPETISLFFGYQIYSNEEDGIRCVPTMVILKEDGTGLRLNRFTDASTVLS